METKVYNQEGKESGKIKISEKVFGFSWNSNLVSQVFLSERAGKRAVIAHTKDRAEVSGGGKKPWQQKGTGRARHGSSRSPIWIGGGITHGPRNLRDYSEKVNKKAQRKALLTVLSQKLRDEEVIFLESISGTEGKTKVAQKIISSLPIEKKASTLVIIPRKDDSVWRSMRNIENVTLVEARNLNISIALSHKYLVIIQDSGDVLEKTFSK